MKNKAGRPPRVLSTCLSLCLSLYLMAAGADPVRDGARTLVTARKTAATQMNAWGRLPLTFEPNAGQTDARVRMMSRGRNHNLFLTGDEAVLTLHFGQTFARKSPAVHGQDVLRMRFAGARRDAGVTGVDPLPGRTHYLTGSDPAKWRADVPQYTSARYHDLWPGIDMHWYGDQSRLEYDFVVAPGADPARIRLVFNVPARLLASGDLALRLPGGAVRHQRPVIYQNIDGQRRIVAGRYVRHSAREIGFVIGAYDRGRPLVIDPVLSWSTYLPGADTGQAIAVDAAGNVYVAGVADSAQFPATPGAFQTMPGRVGSDAFVAKFNPAGSALVYATYLGGGAPDEATGIVVDNAGVVIVTGQTNSTNFPTTAGAYQTRYGGTTDAFVTKLNAAGAALVWSTYLGDTGEESMSGSTGLALDSAGNVLVAGATRGVFPTTAGALQRQTGGEVDAFVTKLNAAGTALIWSTYLGGVFTDAATALAVDGAGNVVVAGGTDSWNFPVTAGAFQPNYGGDDVDGFVARINATGTALLSSTYLGGNDVDLVRGMSPDGAGNAWLTGMTLSTNFPVTPGALQTT
ncbi:MAG: SBBP repeat-containing protein, partial [Blastocatellia bacterium]